MPDHVATATDYRAADIDLQSRANPDDRDESTLDATRTDLAATDDAADSRDDLDIEANRGVTARAVIPMPHEVEPDSAPHQAEPDSAAPESHAGATNGGLLPEGEVAALRERLHDIQLRFVDDPRGTATASRDLVAELLDEVAAVVAARRQELGDVDTDETESLRTTVQRHRDLAARLLAL